MVVNGNALIPQIVGADDSGVATSVAAAEPPFLQHRYIRDTVFLREIIGGSESVPACADDHDVIGGLRRGIAPLRGPVLVPGCGLAQKTEQRVLHGFSVSTSGAATTSRAPG